MQAVAYLAPALAPLAIKLIDKYIFDDQPAPVPQIIQIPAPPQCACCCGQKSTNEYDNSTDRSCSTCASEQSNSWLSTKSRVRSSSTSDAYGKEKSKSSTRSRSTLRINDDTGKSEKKSNKYSDADTLDILAVNLEKEISGRHTKEKTKKSTCSRSTLRMGDDTGRSGKKSDKRGNENTLDILAFHLKKEISGRDKKEKSETLTRSRSTLKMSDDTGKSEKKSNKHSNSKSLDIRAVLSEKEISIRRSKTSSRVPESPVRSINRHQNPSSTRYLEPK